MSEQGGTSELNHTLESGGTAQVSTFLFNYHCLDTKLGGLS